MASVGREIEDRLVKHFTPLVGELLARNAVVACAKRIGKKIDDLNENDEEKLRVMIENAFGLR